MEKLANKLAASKNIKHLYFKHLDKIRKKMIDSCGIKKENICRIY
jgi:hypothetical protein